MKNVIIKEKNISNIVELFVVVRKALNECKDTQIFISEKLFKRLLKENKASIIWEEDVQNSLHYSDKVERAYILRITENYETKVTQMHFVENCSNYRQLTFLAFKGIVYRHYLKGMKTILIITSD